MPTVAVITHWWLRIDRRAACGDDYEGGVTVYSPGTVTCTDCLDFLRRNGCDGKKDGSHSWPISGAYCYCQRARWKS